MQVNITPIQIDTENGSVTCPTAKAFVAASDSLALRLVPIDSDGLEYPEHDISIVGSSNDQVIIGFLTDLEGLIHTLLESKGL